MRILLVNVVLNKGSTGSICSSLFDYFLSKGNDVLFAYGRGERKKDKHFIKFSYELESKLCHFISKFTGNLYGLMFFSTLKLKRIIKKFKPEVVNIHCINGFCVNIYSIFKFLKKHKINTVITHHAEFLYTGTCGYSLRCNKFKERCEKCPLQFKNVKNNFSKMNESFDGSSFKHIAVSPWVEKRIKESKILKGCNCRTIFNPINKLENSKNNPYKKDDKNILYVCSDFNNPEKGGQQIFEIAKQNKNLNFYVIGGEDFSNFENIHFLGKLNYKQLADYYFYADCTIILSKVETFSMVVGESLTYGTPVVGFKANGPETIALDEFSTFVEQGDYLGFTEALNQIIEKNLDKDLISLSANRRFSINVIGESYLDYYEQ